MYIRLIIILLLCINSQAGFRDDFQSSSGNQTSSGQLCGLSEDDIRGPLQDLFLGGGTPFECARDFVAIGRAQCNCNIPRPFNDYYLKTFEKQKNEAEKEAKKEYQKFLRSKFYNIVDKLSILDLSLKKGFIGEGFLAMVPQCQFNFIDSEISKKMNDYSRKGIDGGEVGCSRNGKENLRGIFKGSETLKNAPFKKQIEKYLANAPLEIEGEKLCIGHKAYLSLMTTKKKRDQSFVDIKRKFCTPEDSPYESDNTDCKEQKPRHSKTFLLDRRDGGKVFALSEKGNPIYKYHYSNFDGVRSDIEKIESDPEEKDMKRVFKDVAEGALRESLRGADSNEKDPLLKILLDHNGDLDLSKINSAEELYSNFDLMRDLLIGINTECGQFADSVVEFSCSDEIPKNPEIYSAIYAPALAKTMGVGDDFDLVVMATQNNLFCEDKSEKPISEGVNVGSPRLRNVSFLERIDLRDEVKEINSNIKRNRDKIMSGGMEYINFNSEMCPLLECDKNDCSNPNYIKQIIVNNLRDSSKKINDEVEKELKELKKTFEKNKADVLACAEKMKSSKRKLKLDNLAEVNRYNDDVKPEFSTPCVYSEEHKAFYYVGNPDEYASDMDSEWEDYAQMPEYLSKQKSSEVAAFIKDIGNGNITSEEIEKLEAIEELAYLVDIDEKTLLDNGSDVSGLLEASTSLGFEDGSSQGDSLGLNYLLNGSEDEKKALEEYASTKVPEELLSAPSADSTLSKSSGIPYTRRTVEPPKVNVFNEPIKRAGSVGDGQGDNVDENKRILPSRRPSSIYSSMRENIPKPTSEQSSVRTFSSSESNNSEERGAKGVREKEAEREDRNYSDFKRDQKFERDVVKNSANDNFLEQGKKLIDSINTNAEDRISALEDELGRREAEQRSIERQINEKLAEKERASSYKSFDIPSSRSTASSYSSNQYRDDVGGEDFSKYVPQAESQMMGEKTDGKKSSALSGSSSRSVSSSGKGGGGGRKVGDIAVEAAKGSIAKALGLTEVTFEGVKDWEVPYIFDEKLFERVLKEFGGDLHRLVEDFGIMGRRFHVIKEVEEVKDGKVLKRVKLLTYDFVPEGLKDPEKALSNFDFRMQTIEAVESFYKIEEEELLYVSLENVARNTKLVEERYLTPDEVFKYRSRIGNAKNFERMKELHNYKIYSYRYGVHNPEKEEEIMKEKEENETI